MANTWFCTKLKSMTTTALFHLFVGADTYFNHSSYARHGHCRFFSQMFLCVRFVPQVWCTTSAKAFHLGIALAVRARCVRAFTTELSFRLHCNALTTPSCMDTASPFATLAQSIPRTLFFDVSKIASMLRCTRFRSTRALWTVLCIPNETYRLRANCIEAHQRIARILRMLARSMSPTIRRYLGDWAKQMF